MSGTARGVLALLGLLPLAGCYTYDPATLAEVSPPMRVQARLTAAEAERIGSFVPLEGRVLRGEVIQADEEAVLLLVPVTTNVVGTRVQTLEQRLRIPTGGITEIETRRLDRLKTGLLIGAGAAVVGGVVAASLDGGFRSDRPGGGGPAEVVIPFGLTFRFGR